MPVRRLPWELLRNSDERSHKLQIPDPDWRQCLQAEQKSPFTIPDLSLVQSQNIEPLGPKHSQRCRCRSEIL